MSSGGIQVEFIRDLRNTPKITGSISNPRTTGNLQYRESSNDHILSYIVQEYLKCANKDCNVTIKLVYRITEKGKKNCHFYKVSGEDHKINCCKRYVDIKKPLIKRYVENILENNPQITPTLLKMAAAHNFGDTPALNAFSKLEKKL